MEIFEQYMNDKEDYNSEKIYPFTKIVGIDDVYDLNNLVNDNNEKDFYAIGSIFFNGVVGYYSNHIKDIIVEELNYNEWRRIANTPLTRPSHNRPIYYVKSNVIHITPTGSTLPGSYEMTYIAKPKKANWTYVVVDTKALYNPGALDHQDFQLHVSEETTLVLKILQLAGIGIKDYNVVQVAAQKEMNKIQQEKQ